MKRPHLLAFDGQAGELAGLLEIVAAAGHRVGWLDLTATAEPPPELAPSAELPLLRAVAVGPHRTVTVKRRRGAPVIADLLREHFLGCRLVIVRGARGLPTLEPSPPPGSGWTIERPSGGRLRRTAEQLSNDLGKSDPW